MKSNEKPSVCNTFATRYLRNPVNTGTFGYPSDNKSYPRDNLYYFKNNKTPKTSRFSGFSFALILPFFIVRLAAPVAKGCESLVRPSSGMDTAKPRVSAVRRHQAYS